MQGGCRRSFRRRVAFLSSFPGPDSRWKEGFYTLGKKPPKNTRRSGRASTEMAPGTADIQASRAKKQKAVLQTSLDLDWLPSQGHPCLRPSLFGVGFH